MSDDNAPLVATLKAGQGYDAPWVVVRADTPTTLVQRLDSLAQQAVLAKVAEVAVELHGVYNAAKGLGGTAVAVEGNAPAQPQQAAWSAPQQQAPTAPAPSQPAPQAPGAPGPAPVCSHGSMQLKQSKPGAAKPWKAWMCSAGRSAPDKCEPVWLR